MIPGDEETAIVVAGHCSSLTEAQWREITESLPEPRCDAQTVAKLAEIPGVVVVELRNAIEAVRAQPTRAEMAKNVRAVRVSRQFDETDPNMLAVFEQSFLDRERRTQERTRKLADKAERGLRREGKGNKPYYPQSDGIDPATKCALFISVKLNWPAVRNGQAQAACEALWAAAGGDVQRRAVGPPNRRERDGFWRDHLREAQKRRDTLYSRIIERALIP
jgi:hypothetical protein